VFGGTVLRLWADFLCLEEVRNVFIPHPRSGGERGNIYFGSLSFLALGARRHLDPLWAAPRQYVPGSTISIGYDCNKPAISGPRRQANIIIRQPDAVHTGLDRSGNASLQDGLNALRVNHRKFDRKGSRVGNEQVKGWFFVSG